MAGPQRDRWTQFAEPPPGVDELLPARSSPEVHELSGSAWPAFLRERRWRRTMLVGGGVALAGLIAIFGGSSPEGVPAEPQQSPLQEAFELQNAGHIEQAAVLYREVVADDPNSVVANFNLGVIENLLGLSEESAASYANVLKIEPTHVPALYNLAILRTASGDTDGAIELYRRVLAVDPNQATSLLNLGILLLENGEDIEASEMLSRALQLNPSLDPGGAAGIDAGTTPLTSAP